MEEFSTFKQMRCVDDFADKFEEFKSLLLQTYPYLTDEFLDNFIARLKQQLRCFVRTARLNSIEDAIWLAKQFEKGLKSNESKKTLSYTTPKPTYTNKKTNQYTKPYNPRNQEQKKSLIHLEPQLQTPLTPLPNHLKSVDSRLS